MTAIALALVACCAMVCGTVGWAHWLTQQTSADRSSELAKKALARADSAVDTLKAAGVDIRDSTMALDHKLSSLRAEVDSLRAQMALRGM